MKVAVADYERSVKETEERLARERSDAAAAAEELREARGKLDNLGARATELERQLVVQTTEAEILSRRVQELEVRLGDQGRVLAEREFAIDRLRGELEGARKIETDLRGELVAAGHRSTSAAEKFRGDISELETQLTATIEERTKLQREISNLKHEAESTWAAERVENALLRERINDVAAEVARLTAALEGPDSPIESILAEAPSAGLNGTRGEGGGRLKPPASGKGSLADRIRALQSSASRVASN
jgi:chromosome segregation ATPase